MVDRRRIIIFTKTFYLSELPETYPGLMKFLESFVADVPVEQRKYVDVETEDGEYGSRSYITLRHWRWETDEEMDKRRYEQQCADALAAEKQYEYELQLYQKLKRKYGEAK